MDSEESEEIYSIFLRGIDPQSLIDEYREGKFSTISIPTEKFNFTKNTTPQLFLPGNNPNVDKVYFIASAFHGGDTFATTNCERFKTFYITGKEAKGGYCHHCRRNYKTAHFGWPEKISTENGKLLVQLAYDNCSFECVAGELDYLKYHPVYREKCLRVEENLIRLFNILWPGEELHPTPFYKLLSACDGPIDPENLSLSTFTPTDEIISVPIKTVFAARKQNTKNIKEPTSSEK